MSLNSVRRVRRSSSRQRGVTLLEALVSIVILAIAVLGMLGVQMRTLAETQTGVRRAQSVRLIEDLAERIKANPDGFAQLSNFVGSFTTTTTASVQCDAAVCTPAQLAQWDISKWRAAVAETLPLGQAAVFTSTEETTVGQQRQLGIVVGWRANERSREGESATDIAAYQLPFAISTGAANVACPTGLICHVTYVQP